MKLIIGIFFKKYWL